MKKSYSLAKFLVAIFGFAFALAIAPSVHAATLVPLTSLQSGDLVRGQTYSAVYYYGADGMRYVFPNDKTFFTWYKDFNSVKWVSDANLAKIQIGGNATYKPGVKMIKINSDPRVYAISGRGILREITSEDVAKSLYGTTWNKQIDDVPDGFFNNYKIGGRLDFASQFSPTSEKLVFSINEDKPLFAPTIVHITDSGYSTPTIHVLSGHAVQFVNDGPSSHSATEWDRVWGSGTMQPGDTFTRYFVEKGVWTYYSIYDAKTKMTGYISVE